MTSTDYVTYLGQDSRIGGIKSSLPYEVYKGGQSVVAQQVIATSQSPSSLTFNVITPSQTTLIDRRVLWRSTVKGTITMVSSGMDAEGLITSPSLSRNMALGAFPLHSMCTTLQATINNVTTSVQTSDILSCLIKAMNLEEMASYQETSAVLPDNCLNYLDYYNSTSNVLGGFSTIGHDTVPGRGTIKFNYFSTTKDPSEAQKFIAPFPGPANTYTYYYSVTVTEPLLIPPFIWSKYARNQAALYGIDNMIINANLNGGSNFIRTSFPTPTTTFITSVSQKVTEITDSALIFQFITPHPSSLLPARNVIPYYIMNRYVTAISSINAATEYKGTTNPDTPTANWGKWYKPGEGTVTSTTLTFNTIPDRLIVALRPNQNLRAFPQTTDHFLPITKISINFANSAGILSTATQEQLYRMSVENGLNSTWDEFRGISTSEADLDKLALTSTICSVASQKRTCGAPIILEFAKDIQITSDYETCGSIGQYQFQITVSYQSYVTAGLVPNATAVPNIDPLLNYELVIIPQQSGLFCTERGSSASYIGILDRQTVLDASEKEGHVSMDVGRRIGGSIFDDVRSAVSDVADFIKPIGDIAKTVGSLASIGAGESGGGMSGGLKRKPKSMDKLTRHL